MNPHTSFLLGSTDFETPAEIDGLLDDYFNFRDSATMPYNDVTGEKSSSQQSLQTASSEARRRILFDDPESARRKIMGLPGSSSDQTFFHNPYQESPSTLR